LNKKGSELFTEDLSKKLLKWQNILLLVT
jgi:hypothetical protein